MNVMHFWTRVVALSLALLLSTACSFEANRATSDHSPRAADEQDSRFLSSGDDRNPVGFPPEHSAAEEPTGDDDTVRLITLPGGTAVEKEVLHSAILERPTWYAIVRPPGYERGTQRYPVLYMLHGAPAGATEWLEIGLHRSADHLWSNAAMPPFIIVMPDTGPSYYLNHANGGPRWDDYLADELVSEIDERYRTLTGPTNRAIGGLSMGGDGALRLALRNPGVFGIVGAHSPTTRLTYEQLPDTIFGDEAYWHHNSAIWLIENTSGADKLKIWIDMGEDDPWIPSARALHEALLYQGVDHRYAELPGEHNGEYWVANQDLYLRFYAAAIRGDLLPGAGGV